MFLFLAVFERIPQAAYPRTLRGDRVRVWLSFEKTFTWMTFGKVVIADIVNAPTN